MGKVLRGYVCKGEVVRMKTNDTKYIVMSSSVVTDIAVTDAPFQNISDEYLELTPAEMLVPLRFFEPNVVEAYKKLGASAKEVQKMQAILANPYRLVVKDDVVLSDGTTVDWGIALFDVLENNYLEMGMNRNTRELIVLDSYYRHNDQLAKENQQIQEQNLVKLAIRLALGATHYLNDECAKTFVERVKWLKSPFTTARERQMKQIYRNRQQEIVHLLSVDLSQKTLQGAVASQTEMAQLVGGSIEVRDSQTDEVIKPKTQEVLETAVEAVATEVAKSEEPMVQIELEKTPQKKKNTNKVSRSAKAKKEEIVLEVLEDGTKIVQYERAGYWRTQRNKETGEEKKIWIEPKLMTRKVAAK